MSLWIPFTNRGILGGSVLLYLPMPLVVWVEIMHRKARQEQKKVEKIYNCCEWTHQMQKKEKKLIKRALPSLRSATEQGSNPLTQWSVCCVCFYVVKDNSQTWIYEYATTTWSWCDTLNVMRLQKSRHTLYSVYSPFKITNTLCLHWKHQH